MIWPSLETTPKTITVAENFVFLHPGHVSVIRGNPDLHFEGGGNGPVVITWIGRDHGLYSGASPISLVEHCVTFSWDLYSTGQLVDDPQQKKKTGSH